MTVPLMTPNEALAIEVKYYIWRAEMAVKYWQDVLDSVEKLERGPGETKQP